MGYPSFSWRPFLDLRRHCSLLLHATDAAFGLRSLRAVLLRFDRFFQLERLHNFNRKFFPVWRPRFVCFERWTDAPLVALAYLHVEQLLTPPGPWVRDEDLAAV